MSDLKDTTIAELKAALEFAFEDLNPELTKDGLVEAMDDGDKWEEARQAVRDALEEI
jgi:hypothetical protein